VNNIYQEKKVAIVQSNYIPWKGYFDLIASVDEFILYDDMQYTRRDWRNRNQIKTPQGLQWLTIPVEVKGKYLQLIKDTKISDSKWNKKHWETIKFFYAKSAFFPEYQALFEELYLSCDEKYLSMINYRFLQVINDFLGIKTQVRFSSDFSLAQGRTERLIDLCKQMNATAYYTGLSAKNYIEDDFFDKEGIKLFYFDYSGYPEYPQLYLPFSHNVTILDLIFNTGKQARMYMKSFAHEPKNY